MSLLAQAFYERDALDVARELLGKEIRANGIRLRITEVEAYRWPKDSANHCRSGKTRRNAPMWERGGCAYVYLCYGMHNMLNFVTNAKDEGAAVLIRSCEPVLGLDIIQTRRGGKSGPVLLTGPGKVGQALALDSSWSGHFLYRRGGLEVHDAPQVSKVSVGPRVGINYASKKDIKAPWRLALSDTNWVSQRSSLKPRPQSS